ncbi:hypothetical protein DXT99_16285 [Pontibacter diazotrophicus]|uniref:DUF6089 domain-containing protein n=1 Tax=Pontibacter diazotrophicus TaxID=1400979 RepID=A0A3D8L9W1_9BACT|nr:DUF6089 family protein [Pontibacter diazotrophicus]RDV14124.1 hypothetical protein DXT99_16285 [Pontibacter diazotrophicus]
MKRLCTLVLLFVFTLTLVAIDAEAQRFTQRKRYGSIGLTLGATNYFGDIVPEPDFTSFRFKSTRPNVGLSYTYRYFPRVSFRGAFNWGRIMGDDRLSASLDEGENAGRYMRNLSFRNDIKELSAVAIIDLFENRQTYQRRPDFVPYGFFGIAVFHHNPKAYYENGVREGLSPANDIPTGWYELQPLGTEGQYVDGGNYPDPYSRVQIAIPFGLGVRYKLDRNWDLNIEIGWRKTFTDYLDDASGSFANKADLLNNNSGSENPVAATILHDRSGESGFATVPDPNGTPYSIVPGFGTAANNKRGNASDDDWYITTGITLNYILTPRIRSPKFR